MVLRLHGITSFFLLFLILTQGCNKTLDSERYFDVKKIRIKNGIELLYSSMDWGQPAIILGVFIKGGGALKFNSKIGLPVIAEKYLTKKNNELAKKYGFRFKSYLTWDYLAYIYFIPSQPKDNLLKTILGQFATIPEISEEDFSSLKKELMTMNKSNHLSELITKPMVTFMTEFRSIYKNDITEQNRDLEKIELKDFLEFSSCYLASNNLVISSSNTRDSKNIIDAVKDYEPCFMGERYVEEKNIKFKTPDKEVRYVNSEKNEYLIRLGYKGFNCSDKKIYAMDVAAMVLVNNGIDAENFCYKNMGYFEVLINGKNTVSYKEATELQVKINELLNNIDNETILESILSIKERYWQTMLNKDLFVFLVGKASVISGDYLDFINYLKQIEKVNIDDIKAVSNNLSEQNAYKVIIRMEQ